MSLGVGSFATSGAGEILLPTLAYGGNKYVTNSNSSFTTSLTNLGADGPTRRVHLSMSWAKALSPTVTIGGITAGLAGYQQGMNNNIRLGIFTVLVPTGASATATLNFGGNTTSTVLAWWVSKNLISGSATSFDGAATANNLSTSLNVLKDGLVVAHYEAAYGVSPGTIAWGGANQNFVSEFATQARHAGASRILTAANAAHTVSTSFNYNTNILVAASFR